MFDKKYQCYVFPEDEEEPQKGLQHRLFISRYYAQKWINDNVPEHGRKNWKIIEIGGYFRVFRLMEYFY